MNDSAKIINSIALMICVIFVFSLYLEYKENIAKIEAERENRQIISNLINLGGEKNVD